MRTVRIALVQMNPTVGALPGNVERMAMYARQAEDRGADWILFPELGLSGYPPEDLVLKRHFLQDCRRQLDRLAALLPKRAVSLVGVPLREEQGTFNAAAVISQGAVRTFYRKILLPNYGVFDEKRLFRPGDRPLLLCRDGIRCGLHICEDSWFTDQGPCTGLQPTRPSMVLNLSASPYARGKLRQREEVLARAARCLCSPVVYANLVGGQDELVFDGASMVLSADGDLLARAPQFEEALLVVDVPLAEDARTAGSISPSHLPLVRDPAKPSRRRAPVTPPADPVDVEVVHLASAPDAASSLCPPDAPLAVIPALDDRAEVYAALKLGLRDYVDKNGFAKIVVALSGGIDSALVAVLAADALGPERVVTVTMPSPFSSAGTRRDAQALASNLGLAFHDVGIGDLFDQYRALLRPLWPGRDDDVTEENIQARIRGNIIMALSNKFGWLVLATGNKSELATGYCTLYGDMAGGFAVIKDVPKTLVFALCRWRNAQGKPPVIPPSIITRPPSAELRPDQRDTDSLPPYEVLDAILERYVEQDQGVDEIAAAGFDPDLVARVLRLVDVNEYKRRQGAPGVKITPKAFGRDRRLPITNHYREYPGPRDPNAQGQEP